MILDEAIKHVEEVAKEQETSAKMMWMCYSDDSRSAKRAYNACKQCAEEHRQLAEWLKELKMYRERMPLASNQEPKMRY